MNNKTSNQLNADKHGELVLIFIAHSSRSNKTKFKFSRVAPTNAEWIGASEAYYLFSEYLFMLKRHHFQGKHHLKVLKGT